MGIYGTKASLYSDLSLTLEFLVTAMFLTGYYFARKRNFSLHPKFMGTAFVLDIAFLVSYMIKSLVEGRTKFMGPLGVYKFVYLPTVVFHSIISIVVLLLAAFMVYNGIKNFDKKTMTMRTENVLKHRKFGKITLTTWVLSFMSGIAVYLLLYILY
jgi:uncharacterized membrane protein YozB (DUF420 family)